MDRILPLWNILRGIAAIQETRMATHLFSLQAQKVYILVGETGQTTSQPSNECSRATDYLWITAYASHLQAA